MAERIAKLTAKLIAKVASRTAKTAPWFRKLARQLWAGQQRARLNGLSVVIVMGCHGMRRAARILHSPPATRSTVKQREGVRP